MSILVLLRHGESTWNKENKFTGWVDIPLSPKGEAEAQAAGQKLENYKFDLVYTSELQRAHQTMYIVLKKLQQENLPIMKNIALNERHYGDLQGLNKDETREKFGVEQVRLWRRSYDIAPPHGESLKDTVNRTWPYFQNTIFPEILKNKNILIVAHGNSLRSIIMQLDKLSPEEVVQLEVPTGIPIVYTFSRSGQKINKQILIN